MTGQWAEPECCLYQFEWASQIVLSVHDYATQRVWRNHDGRHPKAEPVLIDINWRHMIIKATEIVPDYDNGAVVPVLALHHSVDQPSGVPHPSRDILGWMFTVGTVWDQPAYLRQRAVS